MDTDIDADPIDDTEEHIEAERAELGELDYVPDPRTLWGSEAARAMMVVLSRRFGPGFAREVHNELASRTLGYDAGCPDDQSDGKTMQVLICDKFWDALFALPEPDPKG